jgi:hypothetical protein
MVIIEGPDAAGKTTLIQHIKEQFPDELIMSAASRMSSEERNSENFRSGQAVRKRVYDALTYETIGEGRACIHDRLFFSELVYGQVLRGGSIFNWTEERHILRLLTAISPPIVFCMPPLERIHAKIYGATQMEGVTTNTDAIYRAYEALLVLRHPRVTKYDYTRGPAAKQRICGVIERYLTRRKTRTSWSHTSSMNMS